MPTQWRTNFINSGQNLHSTLIESLCTYMVQQESQTDVHRRKSRDGNKKTQNKQPFKANRGKKPSSKFINNSKGQAKDSKKKKLPMRTTAPIYGSNHKWGQCHQNRYGENFCHRRSSGASTTSQSQQSTNQSSFHNGLPAQVQVYSNENRSYQSDPSHNSRSQLSNPSQWYPTYYQYYQACNNNNYNEQLSVECFNFEKEAEMMERYRPVYQ